MFGLFDISKEDLYYEMYDRKCSENIKLQEQVDTLKTQLAFLKESAEMNTRNTNQEYERARAYLLNCLSIRNERITDVRVDMTGLFEVFNIPFDKICPQISKDGKRLYSCMSVELKIEDPRPVISVEDADIKDCIDWDLLNKLVKEEETNG